MACKTAAYLGLDGSLIKKTFAKDLIQPAKRPLKTGFIIDKAKAKLGFNPISFDDGLKRTFG
jgi:dTDP-4-dehydrorhamnose reductase